MSKVSWFLQARWDEPQSRNQIEDAKLGKREYVRVAIDCLIGEGFASEFEGPRNARLVRLDRPFTEEAAS
jgi:hypothetical protein